MATDDERIADEVMKRLPKMTVEQKLSGLRNEALGYIITIASVAALMETVDLANVTGLPEEYTMWVEQLSKAVHDLRIALDRYTTTD